MVLWKGGEVGVDCLVIQLSSAGMEQNTGHGSLASVWRVWAGYFCWEGRPACSAASLAYSGNSTSQVLTADKALRHTSEVDENPNALESCLPSTSPAGAAHAPRPRSWPFRTAAPRPLLSLEHLLTLGNSMYYFYSLKASSTRYSFPRNHSYFLDFFLHFS